MAWLTRAGGKVYNSDDLTFSELEAIEKASGVGWAYLNPHRNIATAHALLAVWLVREGKTDEEAQAAIAELTARTLAVAFKFIEDDDLPDEWEDGLPVVDPKDPAAGSTD